MEAKIMALKVTATTGGNAEKSDSLFSLLTRERETLDGYRLTTPAERKAREFARCRGEFFCLMIASIFGGDPTGCLSGNTCKRLKRLVAKG